ncbi:MAG: Fe-S-containing hydro-lyase [Clostridia bacterium]|nr:Fe-S-containing hydro-lyase [Clostridia bacterium]
MKKEVKTPFSKEAVKGLRCGDRVLISGKIYTARDAAHKRMIEAINRGEELPIDVNESIIYYAGPAPAAPGRVIGSCGPTTSCRMDAYAPVLIEMGLTGMLGKGERDKSVIDAMKKFGSVYFGAIGGAGALIAECVKAVEVVAYEDLGTEAIRCLTVENLPAVVVIDSFGKSLYDRK